MGKYSSKDCVFLVDGYNVLGVTTQVKSTIEALLDETTALGDSFEKSEYLSMNRAEISQEGFFDDAVDSVNAALNEQQGQDRVVCFGVEGNTAGKHFTGFEGALETKYERIASRGGLHRANASYKGSGVTEDGLILRALTAATADGDTKASPVQAAAGTSDGGAGYLQVSALDLGGYDSVTVTILDSTDGATWATLATFTDVAALSAERIEDAGNVDKYLAVEWAFNGAGGDPSITFLVGFCRY